MGKDPSAPARSLAALLRASRQAAGLTLQELGDAIGCARSYLSAIENEQRPAPSPEILGRMEKALRLRPGLLVEAAQWQQAPAAVKRHVAAMQTSQRAARELLEAVRTGGGEDGSGGDGAAPRLGAGLDALYRSGQLHRLIARLAPDTEPAAAPVALAVEVPLINSVTAGYPREFTDLGYPARIADEYVRTPDICDPDAFAARVVGDSMEPQYLEGDIVVFSPARPVRSGMDCFVRLERDAETTFKRVFFEDEHGAPADGSGQGASAAAARIRLQPLNARYPARTVPREEVAGLYAAVSVTRSIP